MCTDKKGVILEQVRQALADSADAKTAATSDRFFKEGEAAKVYGVKTAEVRRIAKFGLQQIRCFKKQSIFELCEEDLSSSHLCGLLIIYSIISFLFLFDIIPNTIFLLYVGHVSA